jgi:copper transport protein
VFGVGQTVTAGGLDEPAPPPLEAGLRWLVLLGLSGALGGALAGSLLRGGEEGAPHTPGAVRAASLARRWSVGGAVAAATAALLLLVTQLAVAGGRAVPLLWSSYGLRWGLREVGLLVLLGAALGRPRLPWPDARRLTLPAGAALACLGTALLGHSGTGTSPHLTRVAASAAHVGAATTWSGCVVILAVVLAPWGRAGGASLESARVVLRRFGPPAAVCVAVMVVTGVYLSSEVVGSVDAALLTVYGRTLLLKLALAGVAGALALVNTVRLRRRGPRSTPRRTVLAEAVAALGVLALAAVLTSGQPAMEPQLVRSTTRATDGLVDRKVADLQETLSIRPNRPGPNVVLVDVFNTRRPAPSPVRQVVVSLTSASGQEGPSLRAEPLPDGRWSVNTDLASTGAVRVHVTAMRRGLPDTTTTYGWTVGGAPSPTRPAVVSTAPVGPLLRLAAVLLALALLGAGLLTPQVRDGARRAGARVVARRRGVSSAVVPAAQPDVERRPESARR